ncbi:hypothetical protein DFA_07424 [Cavenderia fasciculata]|uniref:Transmembrane protein n=1 Tax=Cavenderia fasciculata TaxID=261658 RepID=F4PWD7_CACFS|nr:uncharacterized protein DFA_07424 [Cavenderia fasciculata]EGG20301.1 hypothetical protein DFA_07424 [Cavenderia fasciculata]|eukprot:XP_004367284.1 hypothetical protein DFA_07424 [Cavenderia fasciculata]
MNNPNNIYISSTSSILTNNNNNNNYTHKRLYHSNNTLYSDQHTPKKGSFRITVESKDEARSLYLSYVAMTGITIAVAMLAYKTYQDKQSSDALVDYMENLDQEEYERLVKFFGEHIKGDREKLPLLKEGLCCERE